MIKCFFFSTTGPAVPLNLRIVSVGASFVELTWSIVRSATMYRVTYSALTDSFYNSVELSTNLVNVTNLMAATVYRFEVVALFGVLESSAAVLHQITGNNFFYCNRSWMPLLAKNYQKAFLNFCIV